MISKYETFVFSFDRASVTCEGQITNLVQKCALSRDGYKSGVVFFVFFENNMGTQNSHKAAVLPQKIIAIL